MNDDDMPLDWGFLLDNGLLWEDSLPQSADEMTPEQRRQMMERFPECVRGKSVPEIPGEFGVWNSFAECYPDEDEHFLLSDGEFVYSALVCWDGIHFENLNNQEMIADLTHWMRYPEPPSAPKSST